jgi:uncharacterized membrane protein
MDVPYRPAEKWNVWTKSETHISLNPIKVKFPGYYEYELHIHSSFNRIWSFKRIFYSNAKCGIDLNTHTIIVTMSLKSTYLTRIYTYSFKFMIYSATTVSSYDVASVSSFRGSILVAMIQSSWLNTDDHYAQIDMHYFDVLLFHYILPSVHFCYGSQSNGISRLWFPYYFP